LNNSKIPQWQVGFGTYPKTAEEGGSVQKGRNKNVKRISYLVFRHSQKMSSPFSRDTNDVSRNTISRNADGGFLQQSRKDVWLNLI
jgi:hypothetical protein